MSPDIFFFLTGYTNKTCPCGGTWEVHCSHPVCRWVICTSGKHIAVMDYKNARIWGCVEREAS